MAVYLILLGAVTAGGLFFCERHPSRRRDLIFLLACSAAMLALSALRTLNVGVDTLNYVNYFNLTATNGWDFLFSPGNEFRSEFGYSLFNILLSRISDSPYTLLIGVSVVILTLRGIFIWKHSSSVWMSVFVFVSYGFFNYSICTYRQEIAISVALFALPMLQKRKIVPYMLIILLASTFHSSVLFLLPIYFLAHLPLNKITLSVYTIGTVLILLFSEPLLSFVTKYIYKAYDLENYFTLGRSVNTAFIPILTFIGVLFLGKRLLEYKPSNIVLMNFCCYAAFLFILTIKHFVFQRIALLFLPVVLLLLPELLSCLRPDEQKYQELREYQALDKAQQKQQLYRYTTLKKKLEEEHSSYTLLLGTLLVCGWIYFLFILVANRLDYVPYTFVFQAPPV